MSLRVRQHLPKVIRRPLTRGLGQPAGKLNPESRFIFLSHLDYSPQEKAIIGLVRSALWEKSVLKSGAKERLILSGGFAAFVSIFLGFALQSVLVALACSLGTFYVFFEIYIPIETRGLDTLPGVFPKMNKKQLALALREIKKEEPSEILEIFRPEDADLSKMDRFRPKNLL